MDFTAYVKLPKRQRLKDVPPPTRVVEAQQLLGSGSSGLFAVEIALRLGYERLVLCGIPLTGRTTIQENGEEERLRKGQPFIASFRDAWVRDFELLSPHVRSMSGWTRELLGGPEGWE
jgi:hypothetical protein